MKYSIKKLAVTLALVAFSNVAVSAKPTSHVRDDGKPWEQIETSQQAISFANAQNLAARWNNIIIYAKTGTEQLRLMQESGVFADDFSITFNFSDGSQQTFQGWDTDEMKSFYNTVVAGAQSQRINIANNIEVLEFLEDGLRARFKYIVFDGSTPAFGGENEVIVRNLNGRYQIQSAEIHLLMSNTPELLN
ncbi:MAG: hypothetical protein AAF383_13135 [Cyanobacteria bacterium P01_A01_bin.83]